MSFISIVSYNIDNGAKIDLIVKNIVDLVEKGVSLFCLQEVRPAKNGNFIGDQILEVLGLNWQAAYFLAEDETNFDNGLAFFWNQNQVTGIKFETLVLPKLRNLEV